MGAHAVIELSVVVTTVVVLIVVCEGLDCETVLTAGEDSNSDKVSIVAIAVTVARGSLATLGTLMLEALHVAIVTTVEVVVNLQLSPKVLAYIQEYPLRGHELCQPL